MNLKGLLLGSATLLATSGAYAADAIVAAEPEPVDYVRVCDAYGAGFFYIPGTETCLSISGYVWYQVGATNDNGLTDTPNFNGFAGDGWNKSSRVRLNFEAKSDTEWGTLTGYVRVEGDWNGAFDGPVYVDQAWLSLGGLRMGYTESAWAETVNGTSSAGSHSWNSLWYGDQQRQLIQYNFGGDKGVFGTISLEDASTGGGPYDYVPDVAGVIGYEQGWGAVWAKAGYDHDIAGALVASSGFGLSLGTQINIPGFEGSSFRLLGFYADSDNAYGTGSPGGASAEWSVLASYYHQFTPNVGASVGGQYFNDIYQPASDVKSGLNAYSIEGSVVWTPVTNFEVRSEVQYDKLEGADGSLSGYLRFTRFF